MRDNKKTLSDLKIGDACQVSFVFGEGRLRRRLFDMGVTPGANIKIIKVAPLGDPIQVHIRNYELTLRKAEADLIGVTNIDLSQRVKEAKK